MNKIASRISRYFRRSYAEIKLRQVLKECRRAARKGYRIASVNLDEIKFAIDGEVSKLKSHLGTLNDGNIQTNEIENQIRKQLQQVVSELGSLYNEQIHLLEGKRAQLDEFSIALFGRTLAGKSTLMEILTNGDGSSIGKGNQRNTRDVRSYGWKGLKITDVPGVAASEDEGREDEEKAFEAAVQSDLVLFLITESAPQDSEARCLARVRSQGKPILGICNFHQGIKNAEDMLLFLRKDWFYHKRRELNDIVKQFREFVDKYSPGSRIRFIYTHLLSRFLSQQPQYKTHQNELERASRFDYVEKQIISEVVNRGKFLKWKSFIDISVVPMLEFSDKLLDFSAQNSSRGRVLIDKRRQVKSWSDGFHKSGKERIDTFIKKEMNSLRAEIPGFAEDYYDRSDAGNRWNRLIKKQGIERKARKLVEQIQNECKAELSEVARQLKVELDFADEFAGNRRISMDSIFDTKRAWNWGTTILSGGLGLAAIFLASNPLGWAALAVGVVGTLLSRWRFDDREKKASKQRKKLERRLNSDVNKIESSVQKKLNEWFFQDILKNQVNVLLKDLSTITSNLFKLADVQRTLAWALNKQQKRLHRDLLNEAFDQLKHKDSGNLILDIARVPGLAIMFLIEPKTTFPEDLRTDLEKMLGEKVWFAINTRNKTSILTQAIGRNCDRTKVGIESDIQVAHVPIENFNAVDVSRIRLAQQLTELHVIK